MSEIRLCDRHDEEFVPDPGEGCALSEECNCEGEHHVYVPAGALDGAVEALRHIAKSAEHPSPTVRSTSYLGKVARDALERLGGPS